VSGFTNVIICRVVHVTQTYNKTTQVIFIGSNSSYQMVTQTFHCHVYT